MVRLVGKAGSESVMKLRKRERRVASPGDGLRQRWTEWQVVSGRRVLSRYDTEEQARKWIARQQQ